jgi:hypothetical protein
MDLAPDWIPRPVAAILARRSSGFGPPGVPARPANAASSARGPASAGLRLAAGRRDLRYNASVALAPFVHIVIRASDQAR